MKVTCRVSFASSASRVSVRVLRGGRTVARAFARSRHGRAAVRLHGLRRGRYTMVVAFGHSRKTAVRSTIRI